MSKCTDYTGHDIAIYIHDYTQLSHTSFYTIPFSCPVNITCQQSLLKQQFSSYSFNNKLSSNETNRKCLENTLLKYSHLDFLAPSNFI